MLLRDGQERASQVFPFSSWNSEDPEQLWAWMEAYEQRTGNLTLHGKLTPETMPTSFVRAGFMRGLEHEAKLGVNPFKSGIIGSSDAHNALPFVEEDNFFGKFPGQEPRADRLAEVGYTKGVRMGGDLKPAAGGNTPTFLFAALKDPQGANLDRIQRAFYYARVIEIPTPRWKAYEQVRFAIKMTPDIPMKQQERAWTSPIWYSP